jgi:hypothetical protein
MPGLCRGEGGWAEAAPQVTEVRTYFKPERKPPRRRAFNSTLPASTVGSTKRRSIKGTVPGVSSELRAEVFRRAGGRCQADGMHHPDCPGRLPVDDWSAHHIQPRGKGGADELGNLIAVWCPGGLGLNGCHGRLHTRRWDAERLGLLRGRDVA